MNDTWIMPWLIQKLCCDWYRNYVVICTGIMSWLIQALCHDWCRNYDVINTGIMPCLFSGEAVVWSVGTAAGWPASAGTGAVWAWQHRACWLTASLAAPVLTAHLLCAVSVCQLLTYCAFPVWKGICLNSFLFMCCYHWLTSQWLALWDEMMKCVGW